MKKLLCHIFSTNRKRRYLAVTAALWLLRLVRDVEESELCRFENMYYEFNQNAISQNEYFDFEDDWSECEHSLGFLDCAIDDLKYAY